MPTALQTPIRRDDEATQVGPKRYRKQILPVGEVEHEGKTLKFSKDYLARAATAFNQGAYDQVPFQLADPENRHNVDPEKFRGEVSALELADDGLYAVLDLSDEGATLVESNPKLGVSARIVQDHPKGPAIQHVLGTLDPVCTGLKPWEKLDLAKSADGDKLIDLSELEYTVPSEGEVSPEVVSTDAPLKPDELARLRQILAKDGKGGGAAATSDDDVIDTLVKSTEEPVALSAEAQKTLDLATKQAKDADEKADRAVADLAKANWEKDRAAYEQAGVPPYMLDLAEPHLSKASTVIELSKSDSQASAMRKMLEESKGMIDLSERGRTTASETEESEARELAKDDVWDKV